jgi:hypothetical protein
MNLKVHLTVIKEVVLRKKCKQRLDFEQYSKRETILFFFLPSNKKHTRIV